MRYMLELSHLNGDGAAAAEYALFESDTPIPVPNEGEIVYVPGGAGPDCNRAAFLRVVKRQFMYSPSQSDSNRDLTHVQLFCEGVEQR